MKFGLFGSAQAKRGGPDMDSGQGFRDYIEYNVEAEALGYASTFAVEHHFTGFGQVSATLSLLTWVAARTKTLRLGTAVMVLPWHNPVLLAEQAATLDLLSGGRLDFGIGKGYRHNEFAGFCIPMEEADERFEEGLAVVLKAWTSEERFSHHGKYWHFEDVVVEPPTHQKPHPPIWMGAGSAASIAKVAERGFKLLLDQYAPTDTVIDRFNFFKSEVEKRGRKFDPNDVALSRGVYVAKNEADKMQAIETRRGEPEAHGRSCADAGQIQQGDAVELRRHREASRRRGVVWLAGRDRAQARSSAQGRLRANPDQRPGWVAREPAGVRARRHAGIRPPSAPRRGS